MPGPTLLADSRGERGFCDERYSKKGSKPAYASLEAASLQSNDRGPVNRITRPRASGEGFLLTAQNDLPPQDFLQGSMFLPLKKK